MKLHKITTADIAGQNMVILAQSKMGEMPLITLYQIVDIDPCGGWRISFRVKYHHESMTFNSLKDAIEEYNKY